MLEDNNNNIVEEVVEPTEPQVAEPATQPVVEDKALTQEQVNSIVKKVREEEAAKKAQAEATNSELQERLERLEKEREAEKIEADIRAKALEEADILNKENHLDSVISQRVNDAYKDSIKDLVKVKLGDLKVVEKEKIESTVLDIVGTFPAGVAKGTTKTTEVLNQVTTPPAEEAQKPSGNYVFASSGNPANITDEEYEKLPQFKKEIYKKVIK